MIDFDSFELTMPGYPNTIIELDEIAEIDISDLPDDDTVRLTYKNGQSEQITNHHPFFYEWPAFKIILKSMIDK